MATSITWPPIGGASYSVPAAGEVGWPALSNFLIALQNAQGTESQKIAVRVATTDPVTVTSATDCVVRVELSVPGPCTVNLPAGVDGQYFVIIDGLGDASTNNITITPDGAETINGQATLVLDSDYGAYALAFKTGNWSVISFYTTAVTGTVARSDIAAGQPDYVVINDNTGLLSEEQYLSQSRGGLGTNVTAFSGVVKAAAGIFSASDIVDADIDANAGIDATKIADGSVSSTEFQYLSGVTSDIQTQIDNCATDTDLSTHIADTTTHGTTGNIVGDTDAQTLSNKTLTNPVFTGTGSTPTYTEALMWYDTTDDVIRYYNDISGDSVAVGQELIVKVRNQTGSSIPAGSVVYCNGSTGQIPTIALAQANAFNTSRVFGVTAVSIANNTTGYVTFSGLIRNIDTSAFSSGDQLFLSATTPGAFTATRPSAPNFAEPVATVARSNAVDGRLIVEISNAIKLGLGAANQVLGMNSGGTGEEYISTTGTGNVVRATGPTLSTPLIDDAGDFEQIATPSNPAAGRSKLYPKSDGFFYSLDSSGTETLIGGGGSGAGSLNIVDNPIALSNTTGWTAATNYTVTRNTTDSPLEGVIDTCFAISTTTASSETSTSGVYAPTLLMPEALRNTKTQVSFYANIPATSLGVWRLSVYNASGTRMSLASDSSGVTTLPGGFIGQFVTTFDADSSASYTASLTQTTRTSANTLYFTQIVIGNGITAQGAAVSQWITPAVNCKVLNPTSEISSYTIVANRYQRIGSSMKLNAIIRSNTDRTGTNNLVVTLPDNFTPDFLGLSSSTQPPVGSVYFYDASAVTATMFQAYIRSGISSVGFLIYDSAASNLVDGEFDNNDELTIDVIIPIAEWAGNGTVNLGQGAQVEYAYNTSGITAAGASDTTAFAYGPSGAAIGSIASTTGTNSTTTMRVRFQYPTQVGDVVELETDMGTSGARWISFGSALANSLFQGSSVYGAYIRQVNATDWDVSFGNKGAYSSNATYAGDGTAWSGVSTWRWRVRKSTASAPVGFGLAGTDGSAGLYKAGQAPGNPTGSAIASGYIGQVLTDSWTGVTIATSTTTVVTTQSIPVGNYLCIIQGQGNKGSSTGVTSFLAGNTATISVEGQGNQPYADCSDAGVQISQVVSVRVTTAGTINFRAISVGASSTSNAGNITFVRIA
jgi:hypothetical protein